MSNRHANAITAQNGACNPYRLATALVKAMDEVRSEGGGTIAICEDAAVRLIAHQLAFLLGVSFLDNDPSAYSRAMDEVSEKEATNV